MSRRAGRPQLRQKVGRLASPVHAPPSVKRIRRQSLIDRREQCMEEIARLRASTNVSGNLSDKSRHLLTKHWAASTWRGRADILRSAEWLLGIGRRHRASLSDAQ
jgi:hypothetical protein